MCKFICPWSWWRFLLLPLDLAFLAIVLPFLILYLILCILSECWLGIVHCCCCCCRQGGPKSFDEPNKILQSKKIKHDDDDDDDDLDQSQILLEHDEDENIQEISKYLHPIPISTTFWMRFQDYIHAFTRTKLSLLYFASFGRKSNSGNIAHQLLRIRRVFQQGADTQTQQDQADVCLVGGDSFQDLDADLSEILRDVKEAKEDKKDEPDTSSKSSGTRTIYEFTSLDSLSAARAELKNHPDLDGSIVILDAANRRHVGGLGMNPYAGTQEEDLIRCSNLFYLLSPAHNSSFKRNCQERFNEKTVSHHIPYFGVAFAPRVTFLSDIKFQQESDQNDQNHDAAKAVDTFGVIASAFTDFRTKSDEWRLCFSRIVQKEAETKKAKTAMSHDKEDCARSQADQKNNKLIRTICAIACRKIKSILVAALKGNCRCLILTAIGCGVFARNDVLAKQLAAMQRETSSSSSSLFSSSSSSSVHTKGSQQPQLKTASAGLLLAGLYAECFVRVLQSPLFVNKFDRVVFAIAYNEILLNHFRSAFTKHLNMGLKKFK